ncbi:MAG: LamG-like jellyroll fold domain-containing protein, partial [Planctomycetia bacterium]
MPPPLAPAQMGGTGLSGLAMADDLDGWPAPWGIGGQTTPAERVFYVANPITSSIQSIIATRSGDRHVYRKGPDLLTSTDRSFRPVAIQFGPDGCLYVVDWYNKIISHNEVPRNHPDRDRIRGRIWRIRHAARPPREPVSVAKLATDDLPRHLGAPNARIADLAWQEIIDRDARSLVPRLEQLAADAAAPADARIGALWALEGLGAAAPPLLAALAADPSADLRHEGVRIAATTCSESMFRRLAGPLVADPSPRVRAALGDALRRVPATEPDTLLLMMQLGRGRATGDAWTVYDRDFERYLARWALEKHSGLVAKVLDSPPGQALPIENRILATLALAPRTAAERLAGMLPMIGRPLEDEEIRVLASQAEEPAIAAALGRLTLDPKTRSATLRALLKLRTSLKGESIEPIVARAVVELLGNRTNEADALLAVELAGSFRIRSVEPQVVELCRTASAGPLRQAAIRAIREMASLSGDSGRRLLQRAAADPRFRADVLDAWAHSRDPAACAAILEDWDQLGYEERRVAAASLARHREGATALVAAFTAESIDATSLPLSVLVDMRAVLPQDPALEHLWKTVVAGAPQVLRLTGQDRDVAAPISLEGPFTVEAWVNLEAPVGSEDSLLAKSGLIDMNFHDGMFRVWTMGRDVVVAQSKTTPDTWTHYAVTRDAEGTFRIYVDGELDAVSTPRETISYAGLRIGASIARGGTSGRVAEFRVWSTARTADEIRADFDRSYGDDDRPPSLVSFHGGTSWGELGGGAR